MSKESKSPLCEWLEERGDDIRGYYVDDPDGLALFEEFAGMTTEDVEKERQRLLDLREKHGGTIPVEHEQRMQFANIFTKAARGEFRR